MIYQIINDIIPEIDNIAKDLVKNERAYITGIKKPNVSGFGLIHCRDENIIRNFLDNIYRIGIYEDQNTTIRFIGEYIIVRGQKQITKFFIEVQNTGNVMHLGETLANEYDAEYITEKNRALSAMRY